MSNDMYSTASKRECWGCGQKMISPADSLMPLCPTCAPNFGMAGLKKNFGENPKGRYGTDRGGDDYYEVSHSSGYTIRSYSIPGVGSDYFSIHNMNGPEFEKGHRVSDEVDGIVRPNDEEGKVTHEEMQKHLNNWVSENHPELKSQGSRTAKGRNWATCPDCGKTVDLDDAPQDWYGHDCPNRNKRTSSLKVLAMDCPVCDTDFWQSSSDGESIWCSQCGYDPDEKSGKHYRDFNVLHEGLPHSLNSRKTAGEQAPYDTNCDHCGQPGATRYLKMDHTGYPKVDWHCDDCKDKTEDERFEDIMKNGSARRRGGYEEHWKVSNANDPTFAYHDTNRWDELEFYHPKCVQEAGKKREPGWADKVKNNGVSFGYMRIYHPDGMHCVHCLDDIVDSHPHWPDECEKTVGTGEYENVRAGGMSWREEKMECKAPHEHPDDNILSVPGDGYGTDDDLEWEKEQILEQRKYNEDHNPHIIERRKKDEQELSGQVNEIFGNPADKKKLDFLQSNPTGPSYLSALRVFAAYNIDYELFESLRPVPTAEEAAHAKRHGRYPDEYHDRHWDAYYDAKAEKDGNQRSGSQQFGPASDREGREDDEPTGKELWDDLAEEAERDKRLEEIRTKSVYQRVLGSYNKIRNNSMKVVASTPTYEISQDVVPAEVGEYECEHCADGTKATHHVITGVHDLNDPKHSLDNPNPYGAYKFSDTCNAHLNDAKDKEHTNAIVWMAKQGSLKTTSVGKQVCQSCRHPQDRHDVSTEWYCNPGNGGCGGNGVLLQGMNQPFATEHEGGCKNPGAVEYNEGNEYCNGGDSRGCICEGFANTKPKWSFDDDEPESVEDEVDNDVYVDPYDDDDSDFFKGLNRQSALNNIISITAGWDKRGWFDERGLLPDDAPLNTTDGDECPHCHTNGVSDEEYLWGYPDHPNHYGATCNNCGAGVTRDYEDDEWEQNWSSPTVKLKEDKRYYDREGNAHWDDEEEKGTGGSSTTSMLKWAQDMLFVTGASEEDEEYQPTDFCVNCISGYHSGAKGLSGCKGGSCECTGSECGPRSGGGTGKGNPADRSKKPTKDDYYTPCPECGKNTLPGEYGDWEDVLHGPYTVGQVRTRTCENEKCGHEEEEDIEDTYDPDYYYDLDR